MIISVESINKFYTNVKMKTYQLLVLQSVIPNLKKIENKIIVQY